MKQLFSGLALCTIMSVQAGSFTWTGAGDSAKWTDPANWGGGGYPNGGDTANFTSDAKNISESFAISAGVLTINVASGKEVYLKGIISGEGGLKKGSSGKLHLYNSANTYTGTTENSGGELWFMSIANIGEPSSVGAPTEENALLRLSGGTFYMENQANASQVYTTDRPLYMNATLRLPYQSVTLNLNGPITGIFATWRGSGVINLAQHVPATFTSFGRTDGGRLNLLCPTNEFCSTGSNRLNSLSDGTFCGTIADKGVKCGLGCGTKFQFGQQNYNTTGGVIYNGLTNTNCNRDLQIEAYTNGSYTAAYGGRLRNDTPGTCITFNGSLRVNSNAAYASHNAPFLWLDGEGDGVLESVLPDNLSLRKEMGGTWTLAGANTSTGIVSVIKGCLNVDGSIAADTGYTDGAKVTVSKDAILGGTGTVYSTTSVVSGGIIQPGHADLIGTLNFGANNLALSASSIINFKFGANGNDKIVSSGTIETKGVVTVNLQLQGDGQIAPGTYTLIEAGELKSPSFKFGANVPNDLYLLNDSKSLRLVVPDSQARNLVWTGAQSANWDETAENWTHDGAPASFAAGDVVRFDDSSEVNTVTIPGSVEPSAVTVSSEQKNYTFDGNGGIVGNASLKKDGVSTLTLKGTHAFNLGAEVNAGKLQLEGTLDGASLRVADDAVLDQKQSGVISGENLMLEFGYGNNYLRGTNTFTGNVVVDMRGHTGDGNVALHLVGEKPLGNASSVSILGFGTGFNTCANLTIYPGTLVEDVTFVFVGEGSSGKRAYLKADNVSGDTRAAKWYGNVVVKPAGQPYIQSVCPYFELGRPNGTNTITGAGFTFRGGGTIHVYSRIDMTGTIGRDDTGTVIFHCTNNVFANSAVVQGFYQLAAHNAWCTNASVTIGKSNTDAHSGFNLDGFNQTLPALKEANLSFASANGTRTVWTPDNKPATLTIAGDKEDCIWGSEYGFSYISGPLSLTKTGERKFILNGTNGFTGTTTIEAGRLNANVLGSLGGTTNVTMKGGTLYLGASKALNEEADVCFPPESTGVIELAEGVEQPVQYLYVNRSDSPCKSGTYGSSQSAAANKDDVHFSGKGMLVVRRGGGFVMIIR